MTKTNWIIFSGIVSTLIPSGFATSAEAQEWTEDWSTGLEPATLTQAGFEKVEETTPEIAADALSQSLENSSENNTATDLRVRPRFRLDYNGSGGGFDGFAGIESFVPLRQTPSQNVSYFNGRLNLDNDGDIGTNVLFGHRALSENSDRLYGGYAAWDTRSTGSNTFNQLGAGFESLSNTWDWRINGYLPIGNTSSDVSSTNEIQSATFQDNALLLDVLNNQTVQSALAGIDAEVGGKLLDFGENGGDLRGFGGLYYRDGSGTDGSLGISLRLEAQPINAVNVGAGIQYDDIFGTNVLFQVGVSLPSPAVRSSNPDDNTDNIDTLYARIADPIVRSNAIVLDEQIESTLEEDVVAVAADSGDALNIRHVIPATGTAAGTGTAEAPADTIANAVTSANSGDLIYVREGNAGGSFTIPDGVDVRSTNAVQTIATQFGDVQLPESGSGNKPTISNGTVTLGNDTMLMGFDIVDSGGDAIAGNNIRNVTLTGNNVSNALGAGIRLEDVGGTVTIDNNELNDSQFDTGIFITTGDNIDQQLTITGNTISGNAEQGILLRATNTAVVTADIQDNQLTGNNLADPTKTGLEVEAINATPGSLCLNLDNNNSDTNHTLSLFPALRVSKLFRSTTWNWPSGK
ncbi:MAG: right-handed parallel beta-helix repeat-containing protein, partial [Cyanobacteria bacterium J06598_3]